MKEPDAIDVLILRSILGETSRQEEKELREAYSQDPALLERRRELAGTARLLAEAHGVPVGEPPAKTDPIRIRLRSLRGMTSVGGGIAAGLLILFFLFPSLDRVRDIQPGEFRTFPAVEADYEIPDTREDPVSTSPDRPSVRRSGSAAVSPAFEDSSFLIAGEEPASELRERTVIDSLENSSSVSEEPAPDRGGVSGPSAAPTAATAPAPPAESGGGNLRGGVASAPPSPAPPSPEASGESEIGASRRRAGGSQPESVRNQLLGEVSRAWQRPRDFQETLSESQSLTEEYDRVSGSSRSETFRSGLALGGVQPGAPMDDPFAPPSLSRPSAAPARSEPSIAGEKAKDARPADEMPLMGRLFADEAGRSERRTANETAELKKLPDAPPAEREPKPQPRPAPPPAQPARFTDTGRDNFSTFSLNVTDVSFQLAARQLEQGIAPDPRSIRQEEFYNAFDYRDPAPAAGEPVRFEVESATVPGSHNRKVVRLAVKTAAQSGAAGKPAQITFAVDNSGSMQRSDRKSTIQAAFDRLTDGLGPRDRINIVTFATDSRLELLQSPPSNPSGIKAALNSAPEGGTNLEKGLATAYGVAARYYDPAYGNRVVLLSDGIANLGRTEADQLAGMIEGNRNRGIAFDGFGIGWENLNDPLLAELARNGDGHYAFLNAPADAEKIFARALSRSLQSVARDVKVQVEWNADRVRRFRLIGYETHLLKKEDFRNDAVDAAEMAAEETGNAIYLVELKPNGTGPLGTARVRFKMASPPAPPSEEAERILDRLESVVIPRVTFAGASLSDAAQELTMLTEAQNPDGIEGISMRATGDSDDRQVNFSVRNLPVIRILDIMSQQTGYEWGIADNMVTFHPRGERLTSTQERAGSSPTVEERSWIIPNPPVWPEIEAASPRLQLATAAAVFADKLQDSNRFSAVDRAQLLAWTQQAQAFFNNPAEIETLANMIRNATFLP